MNTVNYCHHFIFAGVFVAMATFALADSFEATASANLPNVKTDLAEVPGKCLRWLTPNAEQTWEEIIQSSDRLSLGPRMKGVNETQAEGQLEAFGMRYMPNAYAQYQEVRVKALELGQTVKESFPKGKTSDPTGGTMYAKANKKLAESVALTFRRRDELCFFLLLHRAGIFSDEELAEYDSRPISIHLAPESNAWPDDTPKANAPLSAEDSTFAAKYLPETLSRYQRLCGLFDEGAKQYAELRRTALALDASRARLELLMLKDRLGAIRAALQEYHQDLSRQRLEHTLGDTTAEQLATLDQSNAVKIQKYEQEMGVKAYVARAAALLTVTLPGGATMEMVWCPPGTFTMGSNKGGRDETPHQVTLTKGFWMGKTEVTQAQWKSVMGNNPSLMTGALLPLDVAQWKSVMGNNPSYFKGDNRPVEHVSWNDCQQFCQKTGLQLPTEAQWEYACRARCTGPYAGTGNLDDMGWYRDNSGSETHPVGTKQPNAWGLYDMHGNVEEWCADWYGDYPSGAVTDPQGSSSGSYRVKRGGSWNGNASYCTSSGRYYDSPSYASSYYGFRLVRTLSE